MSSIRLHVQGTSDPFVVLDYGAQRHKTNYIRKSLNPQWHQEFEFKVEFPPPLALKLTVWDHDTFTSNDFLGVVFVTVDQLFDEQERPIIFERDSETRKTWYILGQRSLKSSVSGDILINVGLTGDDLDLSKLIDILPFLKDKQTISRSSSLAILNDIGTVDANVTATAAGVLFVEVISASNLPYLNNVVHTSFDMDPFAVVTFGQKSFRTRTIRHTLDPVWNEKMTIPVSQSSISYPLSIHVYDRDKFSKNDYIGSAVLYLEDLIQRYKKYNDDHDRLTEAITLRFDISANYATVLRNPAYLQLRAWYLSVQAVRRNFWVALLKMVDNDEDNMISDIELWSVLVAIGANNIDKLIKLGLRNMGKPAVSDETLLLSVDEAVQLLDSLLSFSDEEGLELLTFEKCPICSSKELGSVDVIDTLLHISACNEVDPGHTDRLMMAGFLTEAYTSRHRLTRMLDRVVFGKYAAGDGKASIIVIDRQTGQLVEERTPAYIRLGIRIMYRKGETNANAAHYRRVKKLLRNMTIRQGRRFTDPASAKAIPGFIKYHKLNTAEIAGEIDSFANFNEFFYRKLKEGARLVDCPDSPRVAVSVADSRVTAFSTIDDAKRLWIKGNHFNISSLLDDEAAASRYQDGSLLIFRLAPQDYHRYHIPVDGIVKTTKHIPGAYFTVNPMAIRTTVDVYLENNRIVTYIDSDHFGQVAYVSIGATMVGSIIINTKEGQRVSRMDEQGYFAFGGSTIVLVFQPNTLTIDRDLLDNSEKQVETLVRVGMRVGETPTRPEGSQ